MQKTPRPIDDLTKLFANIIVAAPVLTFCALLLIDAVTIKSGGEGIPDTLILQLKDIVLLVVGGAVTYAFHVKTKKEPISQQGMLGTNGKKVD